MMEIVVIILAVIILIMIWCTTPRTESTFRGAYNDYVNQIMKDYLQREKKEVSLDGYFKLEKNELLVLCGVNHRNTLNVAWNLTITQQFVDNSGETKEIENTYIPDKSGGKFWCITISSNPHNKANFLMTKKFEIIERIWFSREHLVPRAFLVAY